MTVPNQEPSVRAGKATIVVPHIRHLRDVEMSKEGFERKRQRWIEVLVARNSEGRFNLDTDIGNRDSTFVFEWSQENVRWMRYFLARFWKAWCR